MDIYRVYTTEHDGQGNYCPDGERFYTLEKLVEYLNKKKAYYRHINEPITEGSILENIAENYLTDIIIPAIKDEEPSMWELMGFKHEDEVIQIHKLDLNRIMK